MTEAQLHSQKELDIIGESLKTERKFRGPSRASDEGAFSLIWVLSEAYYKGSLHMSVNTHTHTHSPLPHCCAPGNGLWSKGQS